MKINALVTERLPGNIPLTRDLLKMLELGDNVASDDEAVRTFELARFGEPERRPDEAAVARAHTAAARVRELTRR